MDSCRDEKATSDATEAEGASRGDLKIEGWRATAIFYSMKACDGIVLTPVKFTPVKQVTNDVPKRNAYIPPSKRAEMKPEDVVLTAEDMESATLFPTLKPMTSSTKGATWTQIRTRLVKPLIEVVGDAIEKNKKELEDGIRQEKETDPRKMTDAQVVANGWNYIDIPKEIPDYSLEVEYPWATSEDWVKAPDFLPEMMNHPEKFLKYAQCMHKDGTSIKHAVQKSSAPVVVVHEEKKSQLSPFQQFWGPVKRH